MKLRPIKIGQVIITPRMLLALIGALFIMGLGIGGSVASPDNSKFTIVICSIISIMIVSYTFLKSKKG